MKPRIIHTASDGSTYADKVTLFYRTGNGQTLRFEADPDMLYGLVRDGIINLSQQKDSPKPNETPESTALRQRVAKVAKQALRGGLLMFGNDLLTILYGTKDHEKVPKGVDSLDWYTDQFARIGTAYLLKSDIFINGQKVEEDEKNCAFTVTSISTGPVTTDMAEIESRADSDRAATTSV